MLKYLKENDLAQYIDVKPSDWQEAITISCEKLINKNLITPNYVQEIIQNIIEHGPYIIIGEQIAMPHAAADSPGVLGTGIAFTKFEEPVIFYDEETQEERPATLFFTLAAKDANAHLDNITQLMDLLMDESKVEELMKSRSIDDFNQLTVK